MQSDSQLEMSQSVLRDELDEVPVTLPSKSMQETCNSKKRPKFLPPCLNLNSSFTSEMKKE